MFCKQTDGPTIGATNGVGTIATDTAIKQYSEERLFGKTILELDARGIVVLQTRTSTLLPNESSKDGRRVELP